MNGCFPIAAVGSTSLVQKNEALAHERIQAAFHQFSETINSYLVRFLHYLLIFEFSRCSIERHKTTSK
jgi:hypothetical protein